MAGRSLVLMLLGLLSGCSLQLWDAEPCETVLGTTPGSSTTSTPNSTDTGPNTTDTDTTDTGPKTTDTQTTDTQTTDTGKPPPKTCSTEPIGKPKKCSTQSDSTSANWTDIAVGLSHSCAINVGGEVACWGDDSFDQDDAPTKGYEFRALSAGSNHTCGFALKDSAPVLTCWGDDDQSQLLDNGEVEGERIAAGDAHTCYLDLTGQPFCEGEATDGQTDAPTKTLSSLSVGTDFSCGLDGDGLITCWGRGKAAVWNPEGEYSKVSVGAERTCAIGAKDELLSCWCNEDFKSFEAPPKEVAKTRFDAISMGNGFGCGINTAGELLCWGRNDGGCQLEDAPQGDKVSAVSTSLTGNHACVVTGTASSGQVYCWGDDSQGQAAAPF